ncbi:MAG: substrate-binding periplasmic protein [Lachnospiraceae bacterium]
MKNNTCTWLLLLILLAVLTGCTSDKSLYTNEEKKALLQDGLSESELNELDELNEELTEETENKTEYSDVELIQPGLLQINTIDSIPGMEYLEEDQILNGFDIELASYIAEAMQVDIKLNILGSEAACYKNQNADCIIASVKSESVLPEGYIRTEPYTVYSNVILVIDGKKADNLSAFKNKTMAIVKDNPWKEVLSEVCVIQEYGSMDECCEALKNGKADGVAADTLSASYILCNYEQFRIGWKEDKEHDVCIVVRIDNQLLADTINQIIGKLRTDGILEKMEKNYF